MTIAKAKRLRTACAWARRRLALGDDGVILDTETTDLGGYVVDIAILGMDGQVLLNTLVNPMAPIDPEAERIHGINQTMVVRAPAFEDLVAQLAGLLHGRQVVTYNATFDRGIMHNELLRTFAARGPAAARRDAEGWLSRADWHCAMVWYAWFAGRQRWQRLPGGTHRALGDCRATLALIRRMAARDGSKEHP